MYCILKKNVLQKQACDSPGCDTKIKVTSLTFPISYNSHALNIKKNLLSGTLKKRILKNEKNYTQ